MKLVAGDLWTYPDVDVRVVTTNGTLKKNGSCVMGKGCALEAKENFPGIDITLGGLIAANGNHVFHLGSHKNFELFSFPVKDDWRKKADISLIRRSAMELRDHPLIQKANKILLPRPGCGNGGLSFHKVRKVIEPLLDDRFLVIDRLSLGEL